MSGLLRICTAGSVDDGKSTLIGRLLYDSRSVYEDQVHSVEKASKNRTAGPIDFSLFTDGLKAEREQGITIDVAYRYFATARRKFILADTPGHEQYTRNMATGASTADVAILLVDARHGVRVQSRRHAQIARLLGITRFRPRGQQDGSGRFRPQRLRRHRATTSRRFCRTRELHPIPISALHGDNVITRSERTPWFDGERCSSFSRPSRSITTRSAKPFRFPVQLVLAARLTIFAATPGRSSSGIGQPRRRGHRLAVRPHSARQAHRHLGRRPRAGARADVGHADARRRDRHQPRRHDHASARSRSASGFEADVVWMDERPLDPARVYLLKHTTRTVTAEVDHGLVLNQIGSVTVIDGAAAHLRPVRRQPRHRQLHPDRPGDQFHGRRRDDCRKRARAVRRGRHQTNRGRAARSCGAWSRERRRRDRGRSQGARGTPHLTRLRSARHMRASARQGGAILWFTGLSGSGKSTLATSVERAARAARPGGNARRRRNAETPVKPTWASRRKSATSTSVELDLWPGCWRGTACS